MIFVATCKFFVTYVNFSENKANTTNIYNTMC